MQSQYQICWLHEIEYHVKRGPVLVPLGTLFKVFDTKSSHEVCMALGESEISLRNMNRIKTKSETWEIEAVKGKLS